MDYQFINLTWWWSVSLLVETPGPDENQRPVDGIWQTFITLCCIEYISVTVGERNQNNISIFKYHTMV